MVSTLEGTLTAGPWIDFCFPAGNATIFIKGTRRQFNLSSSTFNLESSEGISQSFNPLALACTGMDPLTRVLSQVLHTHSLSSGLIYLSSKLNTFSNTSLLAFVYFPLLQGTTLYLYIIRWQHVHTKSGPSLISCSNTKTAFSAVTVRCRSLAILSLLLVFLCNISL